MRSRPRLQLQKPRLLKPKARTRDVFLQHGKVGMTKFSHRFRTTFSDNVGLSPALRAFRECGVSWPVPRTRSGRPSLLTLVSTDSSRGTTAVFCYLADKIVRRRKTSFPCLLSHALCSPPLEQTIAVFPQCIRAGVPGTNIFSMRGG